MNKIHNNNTPVQEEQIINILKKDRLNKLADLRKEGFDPYQITKYDVTSSAAKIKAEYEDIEVSHKNIIRIAGRIMRWRDMGKANFIDVRDSTDKIQVYVRSNDIGSDIFKKFKKKFDIGDIVGVEGFIFRTKKGEISIHAKKIELLSKSLLPLPEKWHSLKNKDLRYRQRYIDLIVNPKVKDTFIKRSAIIREIRNYLDKFGYIEVETPILHTLENSASARPFITYHNTLNIDMYLRIETELYLKKLIIGGFDRVYEIGRIFRNEGIDISHNPEFTSVEIYQAYTDYIGMMDFIENMYKTITENICGTSKITYQGIEIDIGKPWDRLTMIESVKKYAGVDYNEWADDNDARICAKAYNVDVAEGDTATKGHVLIAFFETFVEERLIQPTIIYDYPVENSLLAKRKPDDPAFTERFEYFIYCREMGNAFSELNDPIDQNERFIKQVKAKRAQGAKNAMVDEDFITALEYGMPPTGGLGFGLDRFVMLLTDSASIKDVLIFPTMKPI